MTDSPRYAHQLLTPTGAHPLLAELLQHVFGAQARCTEVEAQRQRHDYLIVRVRVENPRLELAIKLAGPEAALPCPFERTAALLSSLATRNLAFFPHAYAASVTCRDFPFRYLIKDWQPGVEWVEAVPALPPNERPALYRALGEAVAALHAVTYPGFGELADDATITPGLTWPEALRLRAEAFIPAPEHRAYFTRALERERGLLEAITTPALTHEDLHQHNILVAPEGTGWRISGLLDFEKAWAGHAESDLARLDLWRGMSHPALWEAYAAVHPLPPEFQRRKLVYQLLWCLEFADPSPVHAADTAEVCAALGLPPPPPFTPYPTP
jgi:Ser/Thr protein kinase RdoA (MazF antagonist)